MDSTSMYYVPQIDQLKQNNYKKKYKKKQANTQVNKNNKK